MPIEYPRLVAPDDPSDVGKEWEFNGATVAPRAHGAEKVVTANTGTAYTVALANGGVFDLTLTGNATLTFTGATSGVACSFALLLRQDATGGRTVTFPASVKWLGSNPTWGTTASKLAGLASFVSVDGGTTWYGSFGGAEQ